MPTLSITVTAEQAARIAEAYGANYIPPRDATMAEVKTALIEELKRVVRNHERDKAHRAAVIPADIEPT